MWMLQQMLTAVVHCNVPFVNSFVHGKGRAHLEAAAHGPKIMLLCLLGMLSTLS